MPYTSELREHLADLLLHVGKAAKHRSLAGNTGYAKALEEVICNLLRITRRWEMSDANISGPNEVAIDLIRKDHRVAVQVTINATPKKVRRTSNKLVKSRYNATLQKIYVIGVHNCPTGALKDVDKRVERITLTDLLSIYNSNVVDSPAIQEAWSYLQNETRLRTIIAVDDRQAFDYILSQLRCGAIRHTNFMEGNYARMNDRILKLRELILNGTLADASHPGKPAIQFENKSYRNFLIGIADSLESINSILDHSGKDLSGKYPTVDIGLETAESINRVKLDIMGSIDKFCETNGHSHDVTPTDRIYGGHGPEDD